MKEIKTQIPEGWEIDREKSTFECIVLKEKEPRELKWEEFGKVEGFYVNTYSKIRLLSKGESNDENKNTWPTKPEAEAALALSELLQWRNKANGQPIRDWCDWTNADQEKIIVKPVRHEIAVSSTCTFSHPLAFKTYELAEKFMKQHKTLIEIARPLL